MATGVPALLAASLVIDQRKAAEQQLDALSAQPGFIPHLLQLVLERGQPVQIRQAACLYFKNQIKARWDDEDVPIPQEDKATIRNNLVGSMVSLSAPSDKLLRAQIGEAVSIVAKYDFPSAWPDLVSKLVETLSPTEYTVNVSVLQTAHSIFAPWKSEIRSDRLYATINLALEQFTSTYFALFRATATHILSPEASSLDASSLGLLAECMVLLFALYYDMTAQDLPPVFEDSAEEFFGSDSKGDQGWFLRFLQWNPPVLVGDPEDPTPTAPMRIKTTILEICELYAQRYNEVSEPRLPIFVQGVWEMIGASTPAVREDEFVSQAIRFLSVCAKMSSNTELFRRRETLEALCQHIVVPSMALREHEEEQFEDDPLEYIRRDLSLNVDSSGATRRHAASDLVRAFLIGNEASVTSIVMALVQSALASYASNPAENWKAKDTAIYLFTSVASLGSTMSLGVTSTNVHVDVVKFFAENVYADLEVGKSVHPILQVDAIRFIHQFRYQLTKEQLMAVLPNLMHHLTSENYVSHTYAAITIERILFIKRGSAMLFSQADIHETARPMLTALFAQIQKERTPQKIAENEYLMKCIMRVIITAKQTLTPVYQDVLSSLVAILNEISKNPSNPSFDQYCFESISALLRFVVAGNPGTLEAFENILFESVRNVLTQDIDQYVPYVLQIVAQMLEMHSTSIPGVYTSLFPLLITPVVWFQKGSVPPLVRLIKAYLSKDASSIVSNNQIPQILGVIQQRLIPSKLNDQYGFEMLEALAMYVPRAELEKHWKAVMVSLLTRLQGTKTEKYSAAFVRFLMYMMALDGVNGLNPDFTVGIVESIQPGLWGNLAGSVIAPQIPLFRSRDRKLIAAGLVRLLTQSEIMLNPPAVSTWPTLATHLLELLNVSDPVVQISEPTSTSSTSDPQDLTSIDHEEQNAGYQAAYTKLAASESASADPVAYVGTDVVGYVKRCFVEGAGRDGRVQGQLGVLGGTTPLLAQLMA